jgi:hypothetical protein
MERPNGMYLGETTGADHQRSGTPVTIDPAELTTHGVIVGMTGSGKTGLGMVAIEEALESGVGVLILDPKGDMTNLLLSFPEMTAANFAPWVPAGADPEAVAKDWRDGLAGWGITPDDVAQLRARHPMTVFTPGSNSGVPIDVLGALRAPSSTDEESIHDESAAIVQGLLGMVGVTSDPLSGREHVLMVNLIEAAWAAGENIDLPTLLVRLQDPPIRKLGVIEIDTFYPKADRTTLALKLNGLLASPSFASWSAGVPLDIESLLWAPDGAARASVIYLAHLSDEQRQMVVSRVLSKLVTWMRSQSGSTALRALLYMDEVVGFIPPTANPPAKAPFLTLFKQARAFGLGVVVATQNPVDLDYKALSNAGTWMVGRLQTERDQGRLLDGLTAADGSVDAAAVGATIGGLAKREFLLHRAGKSAPVTFAVRWAKSYLAGPLATAQLSKLPDNVAPAGSATAPPAAAPTPAEAPAPAPAATDPAATPTTVPSSTDTPTTPAPAAPIPTTAAAPAAPASNLEDDESPIMPVLADGLVVGYLDPAAPWAGQVGAVPGGTRLLPYVAVRCNLTFDDTKLQLRQVEEWEALFPATAAIDLSELVVVDYDDRDFVAPAPSGARYVLCGAPLDKAAWVRQVQTAVKQWAVDNQTTTVQRNTQLKLSSRPGETPEAFAQRCQEAAAAGADAATNAIRQKLETRMSSIKTMIADAQQKADQLQGQANISRSGELISGAGSVLGAIFGGRRSASSITGALSRAASGRARTQRTADRMEQALSRVDSKQSDLQELESELAASVTEITEEWNAKAAAVESVDVPLEKTDVSLLATRLVWVPST